MPHCNNTLREAASRSGAAASEGNISHDRVKA
jgi:hypothetical protein